MKQKEIEKIPINRDLLNLISPQHVSLKPQRAEIGDYIAKFQYITGYPSSVNLGWLMSLKDIQNTSVSLVVTPIEDIQGYIEGISKGITIDKNTYNTTQDEVLRNAAEFKIKSAQKIIDDIQRDNIPYINLSFLLKTNGDTENNFNDNVRNVKNKVASMGLKLRTPSYLTEKALRQSAPFDTYYRDLTQISNKNMSLKTLFAGLPFSGSSFIDTEGYYLGTDEDGRMIAISLFYKGGDRTNSNVVITGASGSGKSFAAKILMLNEWLNGTKQVVIDPESEYRPLCKAVGGKWIDCSGGTGENVGRINPLQVNPLPELGDFEDKNDSKYVSSKSALALHLDFLTTFFKLYYPEITTIQNALLMQVLEQLYQAFYIGYETDVKLIKNEKFPIMKDLFDLLVIKSEKEIEHKREVEGLISVIRGMAIGQHAEIFNGYTTVKADSDFVCLDVYSLQRFFRKCEKMSVF